MLSFVWIIFFFFLKDVTDVWMKWKFVRTEGSYEGPPARNNHEAGGDRRRTKLFEEKKTWGGVQVKLRGDWLAAAERGLLTRRNHISVIIHTVLQTTDYRVTDSGFPPTHSSLCFASGSNSIQKQGPLLWFKYLWCCCSFLERKTNKFNDLKCQILSLLLKPELKHCTICYYLSW